jgi:16S rRNA (cytosine967-C5)-methyltransferase
MNHPRDAVYRILREVGRGRRLDVAFEAHAPSLEPEGRRWAQELAFGVVRFQGRIDYLLSLHLRPGELVEPLRILLRMGAWQLLAMGSVPSYAAVSATVDQARKGVGTGAAGLTNAVLRRLSEAGGGIERFPSLEADPVAHLVTWGSHPEWLVRRWIQRWGVEQTALLVEMNNRIPALHLKPFPAGADEAVRTEAMARLDAADIRSIVADAGTLQLPPGTDPRAALAAAHPAVIQDPAAASVVEFAVDAWRGLDSALRHLPVADLCAAPGGKGMGVASVGARVLGLDPSRHRLLRMRETKDRLGLPVGLAVARGEAPPVRAAGLVLVDAPCTGTGTLARHPDSRWRLEPGSPEAMAEVQDRILDGAAGIVSPGGVLIYATCSLEPEENQERVEAFTIRHPDFIVESTMERLPQETGTDGAWAARIRRGYGAANKAGEWG